MEPMNGFTGQLVGAVQDASSGQSPANQHSVEPHAALIDETADRLMGDLWRSIVDATGYDLSRELFVAALER